MKKVIITALLAATACSGNDDPGRARIVTFAATDLLVEPGAKTTLTWNTSNVATLSINQQDGLPLVTDARKPEGTVETNPIDDHAVFVMRAEGIDGRMLGASVLVRVNFPAPVVDEFTFAPDIIQAGQRTLLRWATTNATSVEIVDAEGTIIVSEGSPTDTLPVQPERSQRYRIVATGPGGTAEAEALITVEGLPPEIIGFEARPPSIFPGEASTLAWDVVNADTIRIVSGSGGEVYSGADAMGTQAVTPAAEETYRLDATNGEGTKTASITIQIQQPEPPKIEVFEAAPNPAAIGGTTTLSWVTGGARRIVVTGGGVQVFVSNDGTPAGSADATITSTQTRFVLTVDNDFGSATESIEVYGHLPPNVVSFTATPRLIAGAQAAVTIAWNVENVSRLSLLRNGSPVPTFPTVNEPIQTIDASGTITVTASVTSVFELVANSGGGEARRFVPVVDGVAEVEPNDTPATAMFLPGSTQVLGALDTVNAVDVYTIEVLDGGAIYAETNNGPGYCSVDTQLTLLAPDGVTPLVFDDDDGVDVCSKIDPANDPLAAGLARGVYFLEVQSGGAGAGEYVLTVDVRGPSCGDGAVESPEQCDDGNTVGGDGCDPGCDFEIGATVAAPGGVVTVTIPAANAMAVVAVDLSRGGQAISARATDVGGACTVVDTSIELFDERATSLGVKSDGGPSGAAGDCGAIRYPDDTFALDRIAERHYLVVRPEGTVGGTVEVDVTVREPACGNGLVETRAMEQCDDNNTVNGDGCDGMCRLESNVIPEMEPNNNQASANSSGLIGTGVVQVQAANTPAGDDDVYSVVVPAGPTLRFSARTYSVAGNVMSCDSTTTDTRIFLEMAGTEATTPGTGELAFNDDIDNANNVWCSAISPQSLGPGTYFLRVQGWLDMATTSYFLELRLDP